MNRRKAAVPALLVIAAVAAGADTEVRIIANFARDFAEQPSVEEAAGSFTSDDESHFWGPGWEVIMDNVGLGGDLMVNFPQEQTGDWWLDWYGEPLYLSYHFFGAHSFIDPFIRFGLGSAGRVWLQKEDPAAADRLYLSIFPALGAGASLGLDRFLMGGRMVWFPTISPPPGTNFENYPLGSVQISLFAGVALGGDGKRRHGPRRRR